MSLILTRLDYGNATLAGLPADLVSQLQSVMNAAARSIIGIRRSEHITSTLANLHWLKVSERIKFKLAVLTYRCLHGATPRYLTADIRLLYDISSRRVLRFSSRNELVIKPTRLSTVGDRALGCASRLEQSAYCRHFCTVASVISSPSQHSIVPVRFL